MPPVGFEPTTSAGEWPQTYALDHAATGTGRRSSANYKTNSAATISTSTHGGIECYVKVTLSQKASPVKINYSEVFTS